MVVVCVVGVWCVCVVGVLVGYMSVFSVCVGVWCVCGVCMVCVWGVW